MNEHPAKSYSDPRLWERYVYGMIPFSLIMGTLIAVFLDVPFGIMVATAGIVGFGLFVWSTYGGWNFWIATILLWGYTMLGLWWVHWFNGLPGFPAFALRFTILMVVIYGLGWLVRKGRRFIGSS